MKRKYLIAFVTALMCLVSSVGITAVADEATGEYTDTERNYSLTFTVKDGGTAEITGFKTAPSSAVDLVIPEKVTLDGNEYTVTSVASSAFGVQSGNVKTVKTVNFPDTITSIGSSAFNRQVELDHISTGSGAYGTFPSMLSDMGASAFGNNNALADDIVLPDSLTMINNDVFTNAHALKSIKLGSNVTAIGASAFYNARTVETLELPSTLTTLNMNAFNRMSKLKELKINGNIENLTLTASNEGINGWNYQRTDTGDGGNIGGAVRTDTSTAGYTVFVFNDISALKSFAKKCCGDGGFKDEASKKYFVSNNFKYSEADKFTADANGVSFLCNGVSAAYDADGADGQKIKLATEVDGLAAEASAEYVIDFTNGVTDSDSNTYCVTKIAAAAENGNVTGGAFANDNYLTKLKTGTAMTELGCRAFFGCKNLKEVIIDEGLVTMGAEVFSDCEFIKSASIPSTIEKWNGGSFKSCKRMTDITFAEGLKTIGDEFYMCQGLENTVIPSSVEKLSYQALNQQNLRNVIFKGELPDSLDTSKALIAGSSLNIYVKDESVKTAAEAKYSAETANSGKYTVKLLDVDAVADYFQWIGRGYTKGFVYAVEPINAVYCFVQYDTAEEADAPIKQSYVKTVTLNAGEYTFFDVETDNTESGEVYVFLMDKDKLKPHINKTGYTLTHR